MKIKPEHYNVILNVMKEFTLEKVIAHKEYLQSLGTVKNLAMRLRWDLLNARVKASWICDNIYPYANDDHLDTAVKSAFKEVFPSVAVDL